MFLCKIVILCKMADSPKQNVCKYNLFLNLLIQIWIIVSIKSGFHFQLVKYKWEPLITFPGILLLMNLFHYFRFILIFSNFIQCIMIIFTHSSLLHSSHSCWPHSCSQQFPLLLFVFFFPCVQITTDVMCSCLHCLSHVQKTACRAPASILWLLQSFWPLLFGVPGALRGWRKAGTVWYRCPV